MKFLMLIKSVFQFTTKISLLIRYFGFIHHEPISHKLGSFNI